MIFAEAGLRRGGDGEFEPQPLHRPKRDGTPVSAGETFQPAGASNRNVPAESARDAMISTSTGLRGARSKQCDVRNKTAATPAESLPTGGGIHLSWELVVTCTGSSGITSVWPPTSKTCSIGNAGGFSGGPINVGSSTRNMPGCAFFAQPVGLGQGCAGGQGLNCQSSELVRSRCRFNSPCLR